MEPYVLLLIVIFIVIFLCLGTEKYTGKNSSSSDGKLDNYFSCLEESPTNSICNNDYFPVIGKKCIWPCQVACRADYLTKDKEKYTKCFAKCMSENCPEYNTPTVIKKSFAYVNKYFN